MKQNSGGFSVRSQRAEAFSAAVEANILTRERYFRIPTGIEHRFGEHAGLVHDLLYRSMGPTTDLLRYFPDSLYLDRLHRLPEWEEKATMAPVASPANKQATGLFSFFVEYKISENERKQPLAQVPTRYIGIIEREAWLTYRRLTSPNPQLGIYLDGRRTRIALFYAAAYAPDLLYAHWEHEITPIADSRAVRTDIARPQERSVASSTGSGTPWINFDIRQLKPLQEFLCTELWWPDDEAEQAVAACKRTVFPEKG